MILTVTPNPAVDHTVRVAGDLTNGDVLRAEDARFDAGGKGINVSKYLTALNVDTVATGPVGGLPGEYIQRQLAAEQIPHDFVRLDGCTRLNATILTDAGEYKLNQPGNRVGRLTVDELVATLDDYNPDVVVIAGSLPPGLDAAAVDRLGRAGDWDTVVDVNGDVLAELDAQYRLCTPNRHELAVATGHPTDSVADCRTAAAALRDRGFHNVVVTMGREGALLVGETDSHHVRPEDVSVVDTAGAGDALLAGLLAALADGTPLPEAVERGVRVAERVVGVHGTTARDVDACDATNR